MPSERVQRQVDRLLDEAESAAALSDWDTVADVATRVLAMDAENGDARSFLAMKPAARRPPRAPSLHQHRPSAVHLRGCGVSALHLSASV